MSIWVSHSTDHFVCLCVISNQSISKKPCHVYQTSVLDTLLHKRHCEGESQQQMGGLGWTKSENGGMGNIGGSS